MKSLSQENKSNRPSIELYLPPCWKDPIEHWENVMSLSSWDIPYIRAAVLVPSKSCAFDFRTQTWCLTVV